MLILIALQLATAQPAVRPAPRPLVQQRIAPANLVTRKQAMLADANRLLAQAGKLRDANRSAGKPADPELDAAIDAVKNDLDSMSEMGEMESLRLQMAMDRLSKMMSTLSNILKKSSDTAQGITQNLK